MHYSLIDADSLGNLCSSFFFREQTEADATRGVEREQIHAEREALITIELVAVFPFIVRLSLELEAIAELSARRSCLHGHLCRRRIVGQRSGIL